MKNTYLTEARARSYVLWLILSAVILSSACSSSSESGNFSLQTTSTNAALVEGNSAGLTLPIELMRTDEHSEPVELTIEGLTSMDDAFVSAAFSQSTLTPDNDSSSVTLMLSIADLPLMPHQRTFRVSASDGSIQANLDITVDVDPVNAPDVYILAGQSNMIGFSEEGTKQALVGQLDEPNRRIRQLNVSKNERDIFSTAESFRSVANNLGTPTITVAEDPLHMPLDPDSTMGKSESYIGLGLSFAKAALANTTKDIILVPTAWSGSAFCADSPANGQWNAVASDNPALGNTWLFDRAITRANLALQNSGGILRGILWHQGESDSNSDACAASYSANLELLVSEMRQQIQTDARGSNLRQSDSNIPFVLGTMSRGIDTRDDLSEFWPAKQIIDDVHRNIPNRVSFSEVSIHDDLTPANGYECGNTTCVHFGDDALREMGRRYYSALQRAAQR